MPLKFSRFNSKSALTRLPLISKVICSIISNLISIVVANQISRASNKLLKWDNMANRQEQLKEEKLRKKIETEKAVYTKWEKAAKVQEELRKYQQEKTIERAKKWEERKEKHTNKLKLEELGRAKESKKYTNKFGDVLKKEREERTKIKDDRHMATYMNQLKDRDTLMNRYKAEDEEVSKEKSELAKRLNGKISEADLKRTQHLNSTSKKHRDHIDYVNLRVQTQEEIDQQNFEKKFGKNVKKGIDIK